MCSPQSSVDITLVSDNICQLIKKEIREIVAGPAIQELKSQGNVFLFFFK